MNQTKHKTGCFILFVCGFAVLLLLAAVITAVVLFTGPHVPKKSVLTLTIGSTLPARPSDGLQQFFAGRATPSLYNLYTTLQQAAADDRIQGLCLTLQSGSLDFAQACEARRLITQFRSSGKKVIAYSSDLSLRAWYVATACDRIVLNPYGSVRLTGLGLRVFLLKDLLEQTLGLKADFERIGRYKTAPETLTADKLSDPVNEAFERIVALAWQELIRHASKSRTLTPGELEALINAGPLAAEAAVEKKLVDALKWSHDLEAYVKKEVEDGIRLFPWESYCQAQSKGSGGSKIGYIAMDGMITSASAPLSRRITAGPVSRRLQELADNTSIKAILIRLDSPGGDALASAQIHQAVRKVRKKKPVVVSMGSNAASGGYYIASAADYIVAEPFTLTGSIGIFGGKITLGGLAQKAGVKWEDFRKGACAAFYDPLEPFTAGQREILKAELKRLYKKFVSDAARGRGLSVEALEKAAQGRVWTGGDAVDLKLIDALGGLEEAVQKAKELAHVSGPAALVLWPPTRSWYEQLLSPNEVAAESSSTGAAQYLQALSQLPSLGLPPDRNGDILFQRALHTLCFELFSGRPLTLAPFTVEL